jgi:cytoskeletal protein RodZ
LRKVREEQGFNLAILASKLKFTVVELVAIEDGNLYAFDNSLKNFSGSANLYAQEVGIDLSGSSSATEVGSIAANVWDISISHCLRKQD